MEKDKTLTCRDCGAPFTFSVSEQRFFAEKGFTSEPTRCQACRAAHRNGGGAQKGRGAGRGPASHADRPMYDAVCDSCGAETKVPFKPRGDKPIYCRDCFNRLNPR